MPFFFKSALEYRVTGLNDAADFYLTRSQVDDDERVVPKEPTQSDNLHV